MKKYVRDMTKLRRNQGCLTDCVAYILNLHPEHVPYFVYPRKEWNVRLKRYLKNHGFEAIWQYCTNDRKNKRYNLPKRGTHIVCGNSLTWKTATHCVVYRNGKLVYDPQYPSKWKDNRITHRLILKKLSAKENDK